MQSPRLWNVAVLIAVWVCQIVRILSEEKLLGTDAAYREYALETSWRLIPRVMWRMVAAGIPTCP